MQLMLFIYFPIDETRNIDDRFPKIFQFPPSRHHTEEIRMIREIDDTAIMQLPIRIPRTGFPEFMRYFDAIRDARRYGIIIIRFGEKLECFLGIFM